MSGHRLKLHLENYLALKDALGYSAERVRSRLISFVEYVNSNVPTGTITAQLTLDWACSFAKCGPAGRAGRLSMARGFLRYLRAWHPDTQIPDRGLVGAVRRARPYIYTDTEIARLLDAAHGLGGPDSLRAHTAATLIGLLVSSGLRLSEALRLNVDDARLDEEPPLLVIRQTKFGKSRLVPIHSSTAEELRLYSSRRGHLRRDGAFFTSSRGKSVLRSWSWRAFATIRHRAGISPVDDRRPTTHALRHTFAVNRLVAWQRHGIDVNAWLPHLSVYMGHLEPKDTYWYLTATPELLEVASSVFELYADGGGRP